MPPPLSRLRGIALPLLRDDIDTDELIPVWENTRVSSRGFEDALFAGPRYLDGPGHTPDPAFILNRPPYDRAAILVAGSNFGCGSSRESAAWALRDFGIRVVIAVSFNETFKRNCIVNGLAPLAIDRADAERLVQAILADPEQGVTADIARCEVRPGTGPAFAVHLDPFTQALLTSGRSEEEMLADLQPAIDAHRAALEEQAPWLGDATTPSPLAGEGPSASEGGEGAPRPRRL